ncbi:MAG: hypothetical protein OXG92_15700 [Chloroflexi bacterium]|nr:hypothetical protein [Chloroflexota bacterium]MCY3717892.1 hypothetical protein [Chloroflexota bacterium]MDE2649102.1 hypothetical protein [Chloroflexota bacterium]MXV92130.1 hypothetical protein [Chloroflexota bacterium]MXX50712.1 hypothetical protein [Chloroflexota bacterium]
MATLESQIGQQQMAPNTNLTTDGRIAMLEERSKHTATKSDLYRVAIVIIGLLGGLIIHLHNLQLALIERLMGS